MTVKALPTTKKIELINKKKFATVILSLDAKIFVMYILALGVEIKILVNFFTIISILAKYLDYANIL